MLRLFKSFLLLIVLFCALPACAGDLYLNLIWHQHQPLYLDPQTDQLRGPWVRTHGTKDYYDMAAMLEEFPEVHATINLTSSLLMQLQTYYIDRISPFLYKAPDGKWAVNQDKFLQKWAGKTDPWIDLALKPTEKFTDADKAKLLTEPWNAFGVSSVQMARFPEYLALRDKPKEQLTVQDMTAIKAWFYLADFDPDFLRGTSKLDVNLTDLVEERDGKFYLRHALTERDANRLVADAVRVMQQIVPEHKKLMYNPDKHSGQIEIITSPFYHPILPLIIDSDIARVCQPHDSLPPRYAYPLDATMQISKSRTLYKSLFGKEPNGMWPAEGSISADAAGIFRRSDIQWICGDMHVLEKCEPASLPVAEAYRLRIPLIPRFEHLHGDRINAMIVKIDGRAVPADTTVDIAIVFRETTLSDRIGFTYQNMDPDSAARDFISEVLKYRPAPNESDRLLTVILDGENAWEWYTKDMDGKRFLHNLYAGLTDARKSKTITCVTPTQYFRGNPTRNVPTHPIGELTEITKLWPGSWINANYDTWIGEDEENRAWEDLLHTRRDLEKSGIPQQQSENLTPPKNPKALAEWKAYESMYAAEGSDWFWWFGADQTAPGGDLPFEQGFLAHLRSVYENMRLAGVKIDVPKFEPILNAEKIAVQEGGGVMSPGMQNVTVRFVCDASAQQVPQAVYIVGNLPELGAWKPNSVAMHDDGTNGDSVAHDGRWTFELTIPAGTEVQYKYTNSGAPGVWVPSEEFSRSNRVFTVKSADGKAQVRRDIFGKYE